MCDCGCDEPNSVDYQNYSSANTQSLLRRKHRNRKRVSPLRLNTTIEARRILTYDDEDDVSRQCYPRNPPAEYDAPSATQAQSMSGFGSTRDLSCRLDLSKVPGLAIVQRPITTHNKSMNYAGAVRRENLSGRSNGLHKYRAALSPRGRTPCCQDDQPSSKTRGYCQPNQRSNESQKYRAASSPRGQTSCCLNNQPSPKAQECYQQNQPN